jgi:hypothetical protein
MLDAFVVNFIWIKVTALVGFRHFWNHNLFGRPAWNKGEDQERSSMLCRSQLDVIVESELDALSDETQLQQRNDQLISSSIMNQKDA